MEPVAEPEFFIWVTEKKVANENSRMEGNLNHQNMYALKTQFEGLKLYVLYNYIKNIYNISDHAM